MSTRSAISTKRTLAPRPLSLQGLIGDGGETVALLHGLADRYRELGQVSVAVSLLRRALVLAAAPASVAHAEAMAQAQLTLAAALVAEGGLEAGLRSYEALVDAPLPRQPPGGGGGAAASLEAIEAARASAARAAAAVLARLGR